MTETISVAIFYTNYMESFQPGLNFSPVNRAEIASRLHGQFEPGLSFSQSEQYLSLVVNKPGLKCHPGQKSYDITKGNIPLV